MIQSPQVSPLTAADIDEAAARIAGVVTVSPLQLSDRLSQATGAQVYLKREDLQAVRSYKLRGAYNLLMQLTPEELAAGVVCSSAGNHAQGFALACRSMVRSSLSKGSMLRTPSGRLASLTATLAR